MNSSPEDLKKRLEEARRKQAEKPKSIADKLPAHVPAKEMNYVARILIELTVAVGVSVFLGYWLDKWLETTPLFLIIMFFLGSIAGFVNIYRISSGQALKIGYKKDNEKEKSIKNNIDNDKEEK